MANVIKINSGKGVVSFNQQDLIEHNLLRYVRTSHKGAGTQKLLTDHPFETVAAELYKEKYPEDQVKLAEKCLFKSNSSDDVGVDVVLRVSTFNQELYETNQNKTVFKKDEVSKGE